MRHQHHRQHTTVALLGANTLFDRILVRLLKDNEGYDTTLLEAYPTKFHNELLDSVDVLLLSPYLDTDVRWAFLEAMMSTPEGAQRVPVLSLSVPPGDGVARRTIRKRLLAEPLRGAGAGDRSRPQKS